MSKYKTRPQRPHQLDSKSFVEMRVWRVPRSVRASGHEFKYSLAYVVEGECVVRYDNEAGRQGRSYPLGG